MTEFLKISNEWINKSIENKYTYEFTWLGRPIIQIPQDMYIIQELIWNIKPDLIIETGIAHGGSLILSASMLALLDYCDTIEKFGVLHHHDSKRMVIGVDIDIREHNRKEIEKHPLSHLICMIEGSSDDSKIITQIKNISKDYNKVLIFLDSNHTHDHVLAELNAYAPLTSVGSYCVVWDTGIEDLPEHITKNNDRLWGKGNNPKTAVLEYLKHTDNFKIDKEISNKLMLTASIDGFLKRVK